MSRTVAVTGLGMMTGLGLDLQSSWQGLIEGRSAIKRFSLFDPEGLDSPFGVELPEGANEIFKKYIKPRSRKQMTRGTMMAFVIASMAIEDSGLEDVDHDKSRVGIVLGTTGTGYAPQSTDPDEHRILKNMSNAPTAWISMKLKFQGPSFTISTACSSGLYALHTAFALIQSGQCDVVITGSADSSINYLDVRGFCSIMALSDQKENIETASRPFDKGRNGFVIGEGGGILVLESLEHARNRGAKVYANMSLPAVTSEAYNIISPETDGKGMEKTMALALKNAGLKPGDIDYINAHGTSTQLNDIYETHAIKEVFDGNAQRIPVSATKSMTGHCLAGAAGVEAVICIKALCDNMIPPTINLQEPDEGLDLDYVPGKARGKELYHVMCNSFAFGGHNGVCIFSKPE